MKTLTPTQIELLKKNKEDIKAIVIAYWNVQPLTLTTDDEDFDSFASQFTVEPEWKIISFDNRTFKLTLRKNKLYLNEEHPTLDGMYSEKVCLKDFHCTIHSVQYKSETPLTVGDDMQTKIGALKIAEFKIKDGQLKVCSAETCFDISEVKKIVRKLRFITNGDGEEIFDGDDYYCVDTKNPFHIKKNSVFEYSGKKPDIITYFKSKEKATEYVLLNAPKLSVNEVMKVVGLYVVDASFYNDKLIELVKNKQ